MDTIYLFMDTVIPSNRMQNEAENELNLKNASTKIQ
jgi:sulfur relay (sulfurtransferase) complex TusBCD TusD component (DsrE family)